MSNADKYGVGKLIHHWKYYDALNDFDDDVPFYLELSKKAKKGVLELCCGTGRITIPIAKSGIDVVGVDFTSTMLTAAKKKSRIEDLNIDFINQDMRKLSLKRKFDLIFIPFNSLQNIYSLEDVEQVFQSVKKHLFSNGVFAFDIFSPSIHLMVDREKKNRRTKIGKIKLEDGTVVTLSETCKYDSLNQVNRATWYHTFSDGKEVVQKLDMRCFFPQEIDALLKYNGFKIVQKYGDFNKAPFSSSSRKQVFICKI